MASYKEYVRKAAEYMASLPDSNDGCWEADDPEGIAWNAAADALLEVGTALFATGRSGIARSIQLAYDELKGE